VLQEVTESEPLRVVHGQFIDFLWWHEPELRGLVGDGESAVDDAGGEADVELSADFAVRIGDDVLRVGVRADQTRDLHVQAGLFLYLANGSAGQ